MKNLILALSIDKKETFTNRNKKTDTVNISVYDLLLSINNGYQIVSINIPNIYLKCSISSIIM